MGKCAVKVIFWSIVLLLLSSCQVYKQNIMFKTSDDFTGDDIKKEAAQAEKNYTIQPYDFLRVEVFTKNGERLIDPENALNTAATSGTATNTTTLREFQYLVDASGKVKLPMVNDIMLAGLTLRQAEQVLQKEFSAFYKDCFVLLRYTNKRVIVLGAMGGQVIPLANEGVTLAEVLALARGPGADGKAKSIKVLRNEKTFIIDFSTLEGFQQTNMLIESGDVVYVEPLRRPVIEGLRDYSPFVNILFGLTTLLVVIFSTN
jgi:polysaccharide export outer membrane protein